MRTLLILAVSAASCTNNGSGGSAGNNGSGRTYHYISHADAENDFWSAVRNGIDDAAARYGVNAQFFGATGQGTVEEQMEQAIDDAIDAGVDGIAVTLFEAADATPTVNEGLTPKINEAVAAGIEVIAFNIGLPPGHKDLPADEQMKIALYVGQDDTGAAAQAGVYAKNLIEADGGTLDRALCIRGMDDAPWAVQRCNGLQQALTDLGVTVDVIGGFWYDSPPVVPTDELEDYFAANTDLDFIFATAYGPLDTVVAMKAAGKFASTVMIGTVDLSPSTETAIKNGDCAFAVDQQPYMQGYMPIVLFELENDYLLRLGADVQTGPFFVTAENIDAISVLVEQGIR